MRGQGRGRPVQRLGDRGDDPLEEVPRRDALGGGDDGVAQAARVVQGDVAQEGGGDGGFAGGFDAVDGEVTAWCGGGLRRFIR